MLVLRCKERALADIEIPKFFKGGKLPPLTPAVTA